MAASDKFEIKGLIETKRKMEQVIFELKGKELMGAMQYSVLLVLRQSKQNAPVNTGQLQNSITGVIENNPFNNSIQGIVGTNVNYAIHMEMGTRPHKPPVSALKLWAKRKGLNPFIIARVISKKGVKGRRGFQRAYESNLHTIQGIFNNKVKSIVEKKP